MNTNVKKIILVFGGGLLLFWAFKKIKPINVKKDTTKATTDTNASASGEVDKANVALVMRAYMEAKKAGESKQFLADMNREFIKEYGLKVMSDKTTGKSFVADVNGNKVS